QAAVAEEQSERVGIHGHGPMREADRRAVQRKLVPAIVARAQVADHLARSEHPERLAAAAVVPGRDRPPMVTRGEGGRTVLSADPEDVLLALRIYANHWRRLTVRPDDQVSGQQRA